MVKFLTVSSSNMDFVLVFLMMLAFISFGKSDGLTKETTDQCFNKCPAGFHKVGDCPGHTNKLKCKKCEDQTYTALENSIEHCLRCASCSANEIEIKPCSATSDVQCGCKKGYYYAGGDNDRKCQSCRSCRRDPNCRSKCQTATTPPPTDSSTSPSPTTTPTLSSGPVVPTRIAPPNTTSPGVTQAPPPPDSLLFWLVIVLVTLLLLFWLLLLLRSLHKYSVGCCARWTINKDMESPNGEPKFNERSDQGSSPTTLTLNISEETPMMALCQSEAVQESPTHISLLLRGGDHRAARPDEQADRWPAIVLYAIIREVPLRRWKEFLRLLSVADQELERVELEAGLGLGSMERQYQMLRLWSQRSSASLNDVFSALHYMDLSGCAQLLQESLDKLQWRPGPKQAFTACRSHTDHSLYGAAQDT